MVEFALVLAPLLLIILGGIDFGYIFNNVQGVRQGVSDGVRQAAVGQFGSDSTCRLTGTSGGTAAQTNTEDLMCLDHSGDGINDDTVTRVAVVVGDSNCNRTTPSTCVYQAGTPVTVCEQYQLRSVTGFLSFIHWGVSSSTATDRVETANSSGLASEAETPLDARHPWPDVCLHGPAPVSP